ncbi:MAG: hypothetical protein IIU52_02310 [Bacteroidaceae bacterium]|nr:hypothetical protein [Bacteroidaceae bacterium]MBQ5392649.1 hypothetical protein [Bacteroidaceae bacterium]MBQ5839496.1 hypothetical protein [Bacteroidaceae bacterium]
MQIADFGDLGFQRHVIIGIFGSSPFSGFRIRFSMLGDWFSRFRIRFLMLGGWFSGFRGAFLDFPGFDYEFQTLGATEPPRFSEQYKSSGF